MKTIDISPTWSEALNMLLMLLESGGAKGRSVAISELKKMAELADAYVNKVDPPSKRKRAK